MITITWIAYILYIWFVSYYVAKIFGKPNVKLKTLIILLIVNSFLVYYPIYFKDSYLDAVFMIIYFIVFSVEIAFVFKLPFVSTIAATLCFTINYFGTKVLVIGLLSLNSNMKLGEFLDVQENIIKVILLTFIILVPYIIISSKILIHRIVKYIFEDV